ncbi:phage tail fiber domain-containing protein [Martelella mangrovi]|uniref:Tail fiber protein n=1 Tax=Martelella mangrovi TaxID=1397477 RepID=A0ABV2IE08_9HYPH
MALSYVQYQGDGNTRSFSIPFTFLQKEHIEVRVSLDVVPYEWDDPHTIRLTPAPSQGAVIEIRRITPRDNAMVDFTDGSVMVESDMDLAFTQVFYIVQEAIDIAGGTLELLPDGSYGAGGRRIANLGNALDARDAITKEYHDGTFLPQMTDLLNSTIASANSANKAGSGALGALEAANSARDLALQYRNSADRFKDRSVEAEEAAAHSAAEAADSKAEAKTARDSASGHRLNAQNARAAAEEARDTALGYRDTTKGYRDEALAHRDAAAESASNAAVFDPSTFYTKPQADGRFATESDSVARYNSANTNANSRLSKGGDTVTGEIKASNDRNFRMMNGSRGVFWHLNADDLYLMITDPGDQHGSWNGTRALRVRLSDGFVWLDRAQSNTNFGVGGAMVHTDGNIRGSRWESWGNSYAFDAISNRIEDRSFWRTQDYIANSGSGEVGTLGFFYCWRALNPGNLVAGGDIQWASGQGNPYSNPAGTWRCLGLIHTNRGQGSTLFARVS